MLARYSLSAYREERGGEGRRLSPQPNPEHLTYLTFNINRIKGRGVTRAKMYACQNLPFPTANMLCTRLLKKKERKLKQYVTLLHNMVLLQVECFTAFFFPTSSFFFYS